MSIKYKLRKRVVILCATVAISVLAGTAAVQMKGPGTLKATD